MQFGKIINSLIDCFNKGHERSIKAKKQIIYSFGLKGISIIIGLIYVPLLLDYLDNERYGVWLTLSSIVSWTSIFNAGLINGLRNKFTEAITKGEHHHAKIYISTTYAILLIIFLVVLTIFLIINPFLNWANILNTSLIPAGELSILALVVFLFYMLQFVFKVISAVLIADQRPAYGNAFGPIGNIIILIILIILIKTSKDSSLIFLGFILTAVPFFVLIFMSIILFNGRYKQYKPSFKSINFNYAPDMMKLGWKFLVISISSILLFTTSNIIITQFLGPKEVTVYNIAFKYFTIPIMIYSIIMTPIWTAVTEAYVKKDNCWLRNTLKKLNIISAAFIAGIIIMLLFSSFIYKTWLGSRVNIPFALSSAMALYSIINVVISPFVQFINGFGKLTLTTTIVIFQSVVFIPIAIFLTKSSLGVSGAVLATCFINGIGLLFYPLQTYKIINKKAKGIWNK